MKDFIAWFEQLPLSKMAVIAAFAAVGALLPKDLSPRERIGTFFIGFLVAFVFGEPVRLWLGMPENFVSGIAGVLAMTGRNIAVFILRASRNPAETTREIMDIWRSGRK